MASVFTDSSDLYKCNNSLPSQSKYFNNFVLSLNIGASSLSIIVVSCWIKQKVLSIFIFIDFKMI